jgi:hypothetical protein
MSTFPFVSKRCKCRQAQICAAQREHAVEMAQVEMLSFSSQNPYHVHSKLVVDGEGPASDRNLDADRHAAALRQILRSS